MLTTLIDCAALETTHHFGRTVQVAQSQIGGFVKQTKGLVQRLFLDFVMDQQLIQLVDQFVRVRCGTDGNTDRGIQFIGKTGNHPAECSHFFGVSNFCCSSRKRRLALTNSFVRSATRSSSVRLSAGRERCAAIRSLSRSKVAVQPAQRGQENFGAWIIGTAIGGKSILRRRTSVDRRDLSGECLIVAKNVKNQLVNQKV